MANGFPTPKANAGLQAQVEDPTEITLAARTQFYGSPHRGEPNLFSVANHPKGILRFEDVRGEGFDLVLLLQGNDPLDIDAGLNKPKKVPTSRQVAQAGGLDFQRALARSVREDLKVTTRTQAPNTNLKWARSTMRSPGRQMSLEHPELRPAPIPLFGP